MLVEKAVLTALFLLVASVGSATAQTLRDAELAIDTGNQFVIKESYQQAIVHYQRVTPASGQLYATALYNIGVCYYELWRNNEAIDYYKRAIKQRGGNYPRASYALGVVLEDEGRTAEAKSAYLVALAANDDFELANYRLGLILASEGESEAAAVLFRKALLRTGAHLPASHNNLGVMLARMHRLPEAENEFKLALKLSNGAYSEAAFNLELCGRLMAGAARAEPFKLTAKLLAKEGE